MLPLAASGCNNASVTSTGSLHVLVLGMNSEPLTGVKVISNTQPEDQLKVTGTTQADGTVTYHDIKAGEYRFYISRFDYEQKEFDVTAAAGHATEITITLMRTAKSGAI